MKKIIVLILVLLFVVEANEDKIINVESLHQLDIVNEKLEHSIILFDSKKNRKIGQNLFKHISYFKKRGNKIVSRIKVDNEMYGFIDSTGEWIYKPIFDDARFFSEDNIARVKIGKKWGFIKVDGSWLIKPKFSYVGAFENGYAFIKSDNQTFHYINTKGKRAFKGDFFSANDFCENKQAVVSIQKSLEGNKTKEYWGRINSKGKVVKPFIYLTKREAMKGCSRKDTSFIIYIYMITKEDGKWGIADDNNNLEIPFPSDIVSPLCGKEGVFGFSNNIVPMVDNQGRIVYFNNDGKLLYRFMPNKTGTMSLYNNADKKLWQSNIKAFKINPCISKKESKEEIEAKEKLLVLKSSKLKWKLPSNRVCLANSGKVIKGVCSANWSNAIKICKENDGRLPTLEELEGIVLSCGGELKDDNKAEKKRNIENSSYQFCYKKKNFTSGIYWSSSFDADFAHYIWLIEFANGSVCANTKKYKYNVRCVK